MTIAEEKKQKTAELRKLHEDFLEMMGGNVKFYGHLAYKPKEFPELGACISVFESQISDTNGFYVELVDKDLIRKENDSGKLYYYAYNPHFKEENPCVDRGSFKTYFIPIDTLKLANDSVGGKTPQEVGKKLISTTGAIKTTSTKLKAQDVIIADKLTANDEFNTVQNDAPFTHLTIKDFMAITWRVPISDKDFINDRIKSLNSYNG